MYGADEIYKDMLATLHKYCKEKKMTIYALAKATGLSTSSVSNLLKGTTKPYVYTLLLICEALSIQKIESSSINVEGKQGTCVCGISALVMW